MTINMIDVSSNNGTVNWSAVRGAGIRGAYMKATEGGSYTDPTFMTNWKGAAGVGLPRGAYHFGHPGSKFTATQQAKYLIEAATAVTAPGKMPLALDIETVCWNGVGTKPPYAASNCGHPTQSPAQVQAWVKEFLAVIGTAQKRNGLLYTYSSFLSKVLGGWGGYPGSFLWLADYEGALDVPGAMVRQTGSSGTVAGISGHVDTDVFLGSEAMFAGFTGGGLAGMTGRIESDVHSTLQHGMDDVLTFPGLYKWGDRL